MFLGDEKVIIVEGLSDKRKIQPIINEQVEIICTNGTISTTRIEGLIFDYLLENREVYLLFDADDSGNKLRKEFMRELPHSQILYIDKMYKEVETTPNKYLATILLAAGIAVDMKFLQG